MLGCFLRTILDKIPPAESRSVFSRDHRQSQVWDRSHCSFALSRYKQDRGAWWAVVHGVSKSQTRWSDSADMHSQAMEGGEITRCTWLTPKSSISTLPSYCPVLTHLVVCKQICQHPSFLRCPSARPQTWADAAFLQPHSFSWTPFWPAFRGMKPASTSRVKFHFETGSLWL